MKNDNLTEIVLEIPGEPMGKERPRATARGGFASVYTPPKTKAWEQAGADHLAPLLEEFLDNGQPIETPLQIDILAIFSLPKSMRCQHKRKPCSCSEEKLYAGRKTMLKKPDVDNIAKIVYDTLQKAGLFVDDTYVVGGSQQKVFAAHDEPARTLIKITKLSQRWEDKYFDQR